MDGENNGKPYLLMGWFGGTIIFGNTHINYYCPYLLTGARKISEPSTVPVFSKNVYQVRSIEVDISLAVIPMNLTSISSSPNKSAAVCEAPASEQIQKRMCVSFWEKPRMKLIIVPHLFLIYLQIPEMYG